MYFAKPYKSNITFLYSVKRESIFHEMRIDNLKKYKFNFLIMNGIHKICIIFLICCTFSLCGYAQTFSKDTLEGKSFEDLKKIFYDNKKSGNTSVGKKVALYTLFKARNEGDKKAIVNSFIRLCRVSYDNPELALKYIDSSIYYAKKYNHKDYLPKGIFLKE